MSIAPNSTIRIGITYIGRHWRGELSLGQAFWINLLALRAALLFAGTLFRPPTIEYVGDHLALALIYAALSTLVVFPWQVMGVLRSGDRLAGQLGESANVLFSQIGIALAGLLTLASLYSIFQPLLTGPPEEPLHETWERERADKYEVSVTNEGRILAITGEFELGLAKAVRQVLPDYPEITAVTLDSHGGYVGQGRALATIITEHGLDTYVADVCSSACTIAFVAGEYRSIADGARLGFHRYDYEDKTTYQTVDPEAEQTRDRKYFAGRGILPAFLDRIYEAHHTGIWYPTTAELLDADVIHAVGNGPFTTH